MKICFSACTSQPGWRLGCCTAPALVPSTAWVWVQAFFKTGNVDHMDTRSIAGCNKNLSAHFLKTCLTVTNVEKYNCRISTGIGALRVRRSTTNSHISQTILASQFETWQTQAAEIFLSIAATFDIDAARTSIGPKRHGSAMPGQLVARLSELILLARQSQIHLDASLITCAMNPIRQQFAWPVNLKHPGLQSD